MVRKNLQSCGTFESLLSFDHGYNQNNMASIDLEPTKLTAIVMAIG